MDPLRPVSVWPRQDCLRSGIEQFIVVAEPLLPSEAEATGCPLTIPQGGLGGRQTTNLPVRVTATSPRVFCGVLYELDERLSEQLI